MLEFVKFNKIPRLSREIVISEKIDGSNGQICIVKYDEMDVSDTMFITKHCVNLPEDFDEGTFHFLSDKLYDVCRLSKKMVRLLF